MCYSVIISGLNICGQRITFHISTHILDNAIAKSIFTPMRGYFMHINNAIIETTVYICIHVKFCFYSKHITIYAWNSYDRYPRNRTRKLNELKSSIFYNEKRLSQTSPLPDTSYHIIQLCIETLNKVILLNT